MPSQGLKILLTTSVLITAFVGLMWTTMQDGAQYYKHVDEVMVDPDQWVGKRLQIHGFASEISWKPSSLDYRFAIENNGYMIHAEYKGIVPDTFQNESEVVVSGRLEGDVLIVEPGGIMAKCPSKYEAKPAIDASAGGAAESGAVAGAGN
jgi:cytochrome c-type biogenesis protein CcmE